MNLISAQDSYLLTFMGYSSDVEINYFNKIMVGPELDEIERIRKLLIKASEFGGFNINPEYWFKTITKKIGLLKKTACLVGNSSSGIGHSGKGEESRLHD
jgi:methyl-accepting chemotaxis protein